VRLAWVGLELPFAPGRAVLAPGSGPGCSPPLGDGGSGSAASSRADINGRPATPLTRSRPSTFWPPRIRAPRPATNAPDGYLSAVRIAAGPPLTARRTPVSRNVLPSRLNT